MSGHSLQVVTDLRALEQFDVIPAGHTGMIITSNRFGPHLRPGEIAVVDPSDKEPVSGELFVIGIMNRFGDREPRIVQTVGGMETILEDGKPVDRICWWDRFQFKRPGVMTLSDGTDADGRLARSPMHRSHRRLRGARVGAALMERSLTRRGLVAAAFAAVVATLPALAASANPDAELLALREPFDRTWRAYAAALGVHSAAEAAAWSLHDKLDTHRARVAAEKRHAEADTLVDETEDANREIVEAMCWLPARTLEGLAFKEKVSLEHEDNRFKELVTSIMDDILEMGGARA